MRCYASLSKTSSAASKKRTLRWLHTPPNQPTPSIASTVTCSSATPRTSPLRSMTPKLLSPRYRTTSERANLGWMFSRSKSALRPPRHQRVQISSGCFPGPRAICDCRGGSLVSDASVIHRELRDSSIYPASRRGSPDGNGATTAPAPHACAPAQAGQQRAAVDTRLTKVPPRGRSEPSATWAAVPARRPQPQPPPQPQLPTDDSYLDVRVSSLRHHNYGFPPSPRNAIFVLTSTTYAALEDVGRSKVSLRFAPDLALKTPSPLSPDIANSILDPCHNVQQMYSARHAREWFSKAIAQARKIRTWNR